MRSLRRTLTLRFLGTMFVVLSAMALWTYLGMRHTLHEPLDRSLHRTAQVHADAGERSPVIVVRDSTEPMLANSDAVTRSVLYRMLGTVFLGSVATLIGAGWLAASAMAPVKEIAAQARAVTGGATGARITAHADIVEFTSLITVLNDMLARVERAHHWHRRIIRDLGHDLRTPIAAMRAGVEVTLRTERTPEVYRRVLAGMLEEIDRLTLISNALVLLARMESGELTVNLAATDMCAVASNVVARAQQRAGEHHFSLRCRDAVLAEVDVQLLTLVLDQLLDNAVRYTLPGTKVEVVAAVEGNYAELVVEDDGPGVPEEVLPYLFERFYRTDTARGRNGGPGLGLTAASAIVALHRGTIQAEHGAAGGVRIRIRLPLDSKEAACAA